MGSRWLVDLADVIRDAGLPVVEYDGWQSRARSSGGFDSGRPAVVMVHHTASDTSPANDAAYMVETSENRPVANLMLTRAGEVWVLAAGATNTNGKGGPIGVCPQDSMNTYAIGVEACNDGVGEPWPVVQQDAYLMLVEQLCEHYAIAQVTSHQEYAPDRKIDPAGPSRWPPINTAGTWDMDEFRADLDDEEDELTDDDRNWIEQTIERKVRDVLNEGAPFGTGGDPAYPGKPWAEGNAKLTGTIQEIYTATVLEGH